MIRYWIRPCTQGIHCRQWLHNLLRKGVRVSLTPTPKAFFCIVLRKSSPWSTFFNWASLCVCLSSSLLHPTAPSPSPSKSELIDLKGLSISWMDDPLTAATKIILSTFITSFGGWARLAKTSGVWEMRGAEEWSSHVYVFSSVFLKTFGSLSVALPFSRCTVFNCRYLVLCWLVLICEWMIPCRILQNNRFLPSIRETGCQTHAEWQNHQKQSFR